MNPRSVLGGIFSDLKYLPAQYTRKLPGEEQGRLMCNISLNKNDLGGNIIWQIHDEQTWIRTE